MSKCQHRRRYFYNECAHVSSGICWKCKKYRKSCSECELKSYYSPHIRNVYIIYDVGITSIRGIFKELTTAQKANKSIKNNEGCVVMKVPLGVTFDGIDEMKLTNPDYLSK